MNIIRDNKSNLLQRTTKKFANDVLSKNKDWKILDIGCGHTANEFATVIADKQNLSSFYKNRNFVQILEKKLPFKDKEFDFVIASHVIEHVHDFEYFIKELERVSSKGYIELPSRLGDNLIFENQQDHLWWFIYDDINKQLLASKKNQLIEPFITVSYGKLFEDIFRESFVIELIWENKIDYKIDVNIRNEKIKKMSFFTILRKFLSKRIRSLYK